jgi:hypothetical protein
MLLQHAWRRDFAALHVGEALLDAFEVGFEVEVVVAAEGGGELLAGQEPEAASAGRGEIPRWRVGLRGLLAFVRSSLGTAGIDRFRFGKRTVVPSVRGTIGTGLPAREIGLSGEPSWR